ncbi:hypothetical protein H6F51_10280 [Cyanobacteria bacterium FACHB-DQ100]|nr:hypothetical protein [Cyanobacteria bacterium FACHB-DQ100]
METALKRTRTNKDTSVYTTDFQIPRNDKSQSMTGFHLIGAAGFEPATSTTPSFGTYE